MPSVNTNEQNKNTLRDKLKENNAQIYTDMIVNVPKDASKGASFQLDDGFRTPQYVAGAKDVYGKPLDIQKGNMDYLAAFAKDGIEKIQALTKTLDANNDKGLVKPNFDKDTGELRTYSNSLSGSIIVQSAEGENYSISIQQKAMGKDLAPYIPSKTEKEIYGDMGNPNRPSKIQTIGAEIYITKQDKETQKYSKDMGKVMLWGRIDPNKGKLVPSEVSKEGAVIENYFSLAKGQDTRTFMLASQLIKDGFSYTAEQREMEKANPELRTEPKNMTFRIMDKEVAQEIKNGFVKTAEEVTKGTSRSIENPDSKSLFINATLDTASTLNAEGKNVSKTTSIITPAIWTDDKHKIDYTKHIARVDPQHGQRDLKELGENMNKAVEQYVANKNVGRDVAENFISKNVEKTKTKGKDKDIDY